MSTMNVVVDNLGIPSFNESSLIELIYSSQLEKMHNIQCVNSPSVVKFNENCSYLDVDPLQIYKNVNINIQEFDSICQSEWLMPEDFMQINVKKFLLEKCNTQKEIDRVIEEYSCFEEKNMINILRYMIFLVDLMKNNNILWGVGRGSSVSSFILFLIGVHKINSIKYNLDYKEFLR